MSSVLLLTLEKRRGERDKENRNKSRIMLCPSSHLSRWEWKFFLEGEGQGRQLQHMGNVSCMSRKPEVLQTSHELGHMYPALICQHFHTLKLIRLNPSLLTQGILPLSHFCLLPDQQITWANLSEQPCGHYGRAHCHCAFWTGCWLPTSSQTRAEPMRKCTELTPDKEDLPDLYKTSCMSTEYSSQTTYSFLVCDHYSQHYTYGQLEHAEQVNEGAQIIRACKE